MTRCSPGTSRASSVESSERSGHPTEEQRRGRSPGATLPSVAGHRPATDLRAGPTLSEAPAADFRVELLWLQPCFFLARHPYGSVRIA